MVGFNVSVNGDPIMSSSIYSKSSQEHRTTAVSLKDYSFPIVIEEGEVQPVTIRIELTSGSEFDSNDFVSLLQI